MSILSGQKSVPGMNSRKGEKWKEKTTRSSRCVLGELERIEEIETGQRELEARSMIAGRERASLLDQVALKRLYKVSLTARLESSDNEESLGEDASKQRMIDAIDADEKITLVSVQDEVVSNDADKEMFDVDVLDGEEVFVAEHEVAVKRV
nr:hypothetical protein [Tanacetum cinerariifolium]